MEIDLLFKIAAIGILVAVLHQVLVRAGREDQAMMTTLAGVVIVLSIVIKEISTCTSNFQFIGETMEIVKIIGVGFIALILIIIMKQYKPEFTMYISIIAGAIIIILSMGRISGIINLLTTFSRKAGINAEYLKILLKITGIAILTEFAVSICKDSGESAIASKIDFGGKIIVISMSIPIISALLELILKIMP